MVVLYFSQNEWFLVVNTDLTSLCLCRPISVFLIWNRKQRTQSLFFSAASVLSCVQCCVWQVLVGDGLVCEVKSPPHTHTHKVCTQRVIPPTWTEGEQRRRRDWRSRGNGWAEVSRGGRRWEGSVPCWGFNSFGAGGRVSGVQGLPKIFVKL